MNFCEYWRPGVRRSTSYPVQWPPLPLHQPPEMERFREYGKETVPYGDLMPGDLDHGYGDSGAA